MQRVLGTRAPRQRRSRQRLQTREARSGEKKKETGSWITFDMLACVWRVCVSDVRTPATASAARLGNLDLSNTLPWVGILIHYHHPRHDHAACYPTAFQSCGYEDQSQSTDDKRQTRRQYEANVKPSLAGPTGSVCFQARSGTA